MAAKGQVSTQESTKHYLVQCDGCDFERAASGREEAREIGNDHREETGHELVALEVPPAVAD